MPNKCSVPNCKSNYDNGPKAAVYSFPSETVRLQKWLQNLNRVDFTPTKNTVVSFHYLK